MSFFVAGCEEEGPIIIPYPDGNEKPQVENKTPISQSVTINGINLKYRIEDSVLAIGDTLKVNIDSENEVKPLFKLTIDGEEMLNTSNLPVEYLSVMESVGEYELAFIFSTDWEKGYSESKQTIIVK